MSHTGTMRGNPKNRNQPPRAQFVDSPSGIPRPALETHASHVHISDTASTLSASRAKQSKRDEVSAVSVKSRLLSDGCSPPNP
jgi:hypothetical protein